MDIYVVQPGDNIELIANKYGISVERLISDNGLISPYTLVLGQAILILYPERVYTVKSGDTLATIADSNGVSIMQLIRNNPFLHDRNYIYPGESFVINYSLGKEISVNGFAYSFINLDTLKRTLPYLTYISIFNYRIGENANIVDYGDDTELIKIAKAYDTLPLLLISAFTVTGEVNLEYIYELLLNEEQQDKLVNEMLQIVRTKKFSGINAMISQITKSNQKLYLNVLTKLSKALRNEGYIFFLTINPNLKIINNTVTYEKIDYKSISEIVDKIIFFQNVWAMNKQPPSPVSNISSIRTFINYVSTIISPTILSIGKPLIGLDWTLPFSPGSSYANSMSLDSTMILAYEQQTVIQFDELSQTPYYNYIRSSVGPPENHIVWFIDVRSIKALNDLLIEYNMSGSGIWNLMIYNQQLWSILNATFNIVKIPII